MDYAVGVPFCTAVALTPRLHVFAGSALSYRVPPNKQLQQLKLTFDPPGHGLGYVSGVDVSADGTRVYVAGSILWCIDLVQSSAVALWDDRVNNRYPRIVC